MCNNIIKNKFNNDLIMTNKDEEKCKSTNTCWTRKENMINDKVKDHCHVTGKYRGSPYKKCNLKLVISKEITNAFS